MPTPAKTTPKSIFAAGGQAHVTAAGLDPGQRWNVTWILPSTATACANTSGSDRPTASSTGVLPDSGSPLQYLPNTTATGDQWNRESNYETSPCPAMALANQGAWKVKLEKDGTTS